MLIGLKQALGQAAISRSSLIAPSQRCWHTSLHSWLEPRAPKRHVGTRPY
jgi:hypothetical protein